MSQSTTQQAIIATYEQTIGRDPTATELATTERQLASGTQLSSVRAYLATTGYAVDALSQLYVDVVGRAITAPELARDEAGLAGGGSLQGLRSYFATTAEATGKLEAVYTGVLGRPITAGELSEDEAAIGAGSATLGGLRSSLATTPAAVDQLQAVYTDVLGRSLTAPELSGDEAAIGGGGTVAGLRAYLATTNEALGKLQALYRTELDRGITIPEVVGDEHAIAGGSSLSAIRAALSTSNEAVHAITSQFHSLVGYEIENPAPVPAPDLASAEAALARGVSLSLAVAQTPDAAALIDSQYQTLLGVAPTAGELQAGEQTLAAALEATPLGEAPRTIDAVTPLVLGAQNGPEITADITAAFQATLGRAPTALELAADRSELSDGYNAGAITAQIGRIGEVSPLALPAHNDVYLLAPQTIPGSPSFVYGLFDNDIMVAATPSIAVAPGVQPTEAYSSKAAADTVIIGGNGPGSTSFDPSTDYVQIAPAQATSFSELTLTSAATPSGNVPYTNVSVGSHLLLSIYVPDGSLTAANFRFS